MVLGASRLGDVNRLGGANHSMMSAGSEMQIDSVMPVGYHS